MIRPKLLLWCLVPLFIYACSEKGTEDGLSNAESTLTIDCDMEDVVENGDKTHFKTSNPEYTLSNGKTISSDFARSGSHSLKLNEERQYGLNLKLDGLTERNYIQISIWQKDDCPNGTLQATLSGGESEYNYRTFYEELEERENGWVKHQLSFTVGPGVDSIHVFIFAGGKTTYFDDFSFQKLASAPKNDLPLRLNLNIPDSSKQTLDSYIADALNYEAIPIADKAYVNAHILDGQDTAQVEMKLKGDWTDHLKLGKESYRIKIKSDHAYEGLKSFSIQHPYCRKYLDEWILHKMADREDILTTTYDFINVSINGLDCGVYALEEHFDKQLLESRNRREGPILKFDESGYWAAIKAFEGFDSLRYIPFFQQSTEGVFKSNRTRKSPQLSKQFEEGRKLLRLFKEGCLNLDEIFDIDRLAKFYVLMELSGSDHGLRWHNRRFYYNPITQKLEHIAYDILPYFYDKPYKGYVMHKLKQFKQIHEYSFDNAILFNKEFKDKYLYYLEQKTNPAYLDSIFTELDEEMTICLAAIQGETPTYQFQKDRYYKNAAIQRKQIPELSELWDQRIKEHQLWSDWVKEQPFKQFSKGLFLREVALNVYCEDAENGYQITAENYHLGAIEILAFKTKSKENKVIVLEQPVRLKGYQGIADTAFFGTLLNPKKVYYRTVDNPGVFHSQKIIPWSRPVGKSSRSQLLAQFDANSPLYTIRGKELIFSGSVKIEQLILVPKEYTVKIAAGSEIEFANGGGLIATNSFAALGTEANPIHIFCRDSSSNGVTVLGGEEARLSHVELDGLSNLNYKNWELTGALTIYETPAFLDHCTISNNHSEDALNVVRSHFEISNLTIGETYSDGFDADFCTGNLSHSTFVNTGNDCIDFSGSKVFIQHIAITNSGDKGISGGERSQLTVENIDINGAVTGLASKDGSLIEGENITVLNAEFGCAAFQKKPEYSGASMSLKKCEIKESLKEILVELGSVVTLNGERVEGTAKIDIDLLYARFEK
ncbi:MAG: CotH kinase family protein [Flavobacteriales bacterium]|nr:CotH kinase family protein [Flavobacteriales bacterium]